MNRLKFRAWDDENLCWVRPKFVENESCVTVDERGYDLSQWIGAYDSACVEIYSGDIVRYQRDRDFMSEVTWCSEGCCFMFGDNEIGENVSRIVVVGNIYENPELLENSGG